MNSGEALAETHPSQEINVVNLNSISIATLYFLSNFVCISQSYESYKRLCCDHKKFVASDMSLPFRHQSCVSICHPAEP